LEVETAKKVLKSRMLNGAFLRCLKLQKEYVIMYLFNWKPVKTDCFQNKDA